MTGVQTCALPICFPVTISCINRQDAKRNKYREYKGEHNKTDETYRFRDGSLAALPKYYKEKLYTEEEREELWIQRQEEGYKFIMGEKHKVERIVTGKEMGKANPVLQDILHKNIQKQPIVTGKCKKTNEKKSRNVTIQVGKKKKENNIIPN